MARYEITLKDRTVEVIDGADAYQQEGPDDHVLRRRRRPAGGRLLEHPAGQLPHVARS